MVNQQNLNQTKNTSNQTKYTRKLSAVIDAPPRDETAEQGVLGSIMMNNAVIADIEPRLSPEHFSGSANQTIYSTMLNMYRSGIKIDPYSLGVELAKNNLLLVCGGAPYLVQIAENTLTAVNVEFFAKTVIEKYMYRTLIHLSVAMNDDARNHRNSPEELIKEYQDKIAEIATAKQDDTPRHLGEITVATIEKIRERKVLRDKDPYGTNEMMTGFRKLDDLIGPLKQSNLIIVAARPSVGKTALAMNIGENISATGKNVLFISLEMSEEELCERILSGQTEISSKRLASGDFSNNGDISKLVEAEFALSKHSLWISDNSGSTMNKIESLCRRFNLRHGIDLIILDYIQLIRGSNKDAQRHEQVEEISRRLKGIAMTMNVPVIALSQINRENPGKKPTMAQLRSSGALEQDADIIILMHQDPPKLNLGMLCYPDTELTVEKHRNGPVGLFSLRFTRELTRFENAGY